MIIVGVTGSIGMGKTTVARQFSYMGAKLLSADAVVHTLLEKDHYTIAAIHHTFPEFYQDNKRINREALAQCVFNNQEKLGQLETILHPRVAHIESQFITEQQRKGTRAVILDIPLLFETGAEERCDITVAVHAPYFIQKKRVFNRPGMTEARYEAILARQYPSWEKMHMADYVVHTGLGMGFSYRQVQKIWKDILNA